MTSRRPRISSATRLGSTPAISAWITTDVGGSPMYATSTCGTNPDWRTSAERPKTSPNSSSISRRIRSKLAKRSFSEGTTDRLNGMLPRSHETVLIAEDHRLGAVAEVELLEDPSDVG